MMKFCSVCLKCYEDSEAICSVDKGHGSLVQARQGSCLAIKGYRIESRLESRSPFQLYQAKNIESREGVLVRIIPGNELTNSLETDLRKSVCLEHPNLARVSEYGLLKNKDRFLVFEDVTGKTPGEVIKESSPLNESRAIAIACRIAEGLEAIHAAGLVHGAVNPSNIYFTDKDSAVRLRHIDFGGVEQKSVFETGNDLDNVAGPLAYFSPEQCAGKKIDFRSDLYSLGTVLYEMLLGRLPFDSPTKDAISNYVFDESDVWGLHIELRALIAHILKQSFQRRLDLRPRSTENFVRQLRHLELLATRLEHKTSEGSDGVVKVKDAPRSDQNPDTDSGLTMPAIPGNPPSRTTTPRAAVESQQDEFEDDGSFETVEIERHRDEKRARHLAISDTEYLESVEYLPVPVETKRNRVVKKKKKPVAPKAVRIENAAVNYVRSPATRALIFVAGFLVSAVFGGVVTAGFLRLDGNSVTDQPGTPVADRTKPVQDLPKIEPLPTSEDVVIDSLPEPDNTRELDQVVTLSSSDEGPDASVPARAAKSQTNFKSKPKKRNRKPVRRKRNKAPSKQEGAALPDTIKDVVIYY